MNKRSHLSSTIQTCLRTFRHLIIHMGKYLIIHMGKYLIIHMGKLYTVHNDSLQLYTGRWKAAYIRTTLLLIGNRMDI